MGIIGFILVAVAGAIFKGTWKAFFAQQVTLFPLHDATAMVLGVHSTLIQAAESVGIKRELLRPKEQFRGGRRDRLV